MRKLIIYISILLVSCSGKIYKIKTIDYEIEMALNERMTLEQTNLVDEIYTLYKDDLTIKGVYKNGDEYANIIQLLDYTFTKGTYSTIDSSLISRAYILRKKLDKINFYKGERLNFKFIFDTYEPVFEKNKEIFEKLFNKPGDDLFYSICVLDPNKVDLSYHKMLIGFNEHLDGERFDNDGYFKTVLLLVYGNMIYYSTKDE